MNKLTVPLAEHFHSLQGEGAYSGLPMHFLRFPGCSVGRTSAHKYATDSDAVIPVLPSGAEAKECCDFSGTHFWCDTDYDKHEEETVERLVEETFETTVCFSGGEPLIHQSTEWFDRLYSELTIRKKRIHIETSGTIFPKYPFHCLTISPKAGWRYDVISQAHQVKFLITKETSLSLIDEIASAASAECQFFLSPVFDPNALVRENLDWAVMLLQQRYRSWRLSVQVHKWLELR